MSSTAHFLFALNYRASSNSAVSECRLRCHVGMQKVLRKHSREYARTYARTLIPLSHNIRTHGTGQPSMLRFLRLVAVKALCVRVRISACILESEVNLLQTVC